MSVKKKVVIAFIIFTTIAGFLFISFVFYSMRQRTAPKELMSSLLFRAKQTVSKTSYKRSYPKVIKGNWEPGAFRQIIYSSAETKGLKDMGVNMMSITASYEIQKDGSISVIGEQQVPVDIAKAKDSGFAVLLSTENPPDQNVTYGSDKEENLKIFLSGAEEAAIKFAKIAEKYKVEYFAPQNELNDNFDWEYFPERLMGNEGASARARETTNLYKRLLPKLRKVFKGKLVAKTGTPNPGIRVDGYDYVAITLDRFEDDINKLMSESWRDYLALDLYREKVRDDYKTVAAVAKASKTDWFVGEVYFFFDEQSLEFLTDEQQKALKDVQPDNFRISLEEYVNFAGSPKPSGYTFLGYLQEGNVIKGTKSQDIIKEYFTKKM